MDCNDCISEISAKLSALPTAWRDSIASILCKERELKNSTLTCSEIKDCETLTSLSAFSIVGNTVSITYSDENQVSYTRSFNIEDLINASLDGIDPKCLTTQQAWQSLNFLGKFQILVDKHCDCCDLSSLPLCPIATNLQVDGNFTATWDNSAVNASSNATFQRIGKRVKAVGGSYITTGFTPSNDLAKTVSSASTTGLDNTIYEYQLQTLCTEGGPTIAAIREGIHFACIAPQIIFDDTSAIVTVGLTNLDITRVRFTLRKQSDNSIVSGPLEITKSAGQAQTTFNALDASTSYYVQLEFFAFINGVEVVSSNGSYLGAVCGPYAFTTSATPTTTTTTTTVAPTTTTTTSSTSTTTTVLCVTYQFANTNLISGASIIVNYIDCAGNPQSEVIVPQQTIQRCALQNSYSGPGALQANQVQVGCASTNCVSYLLENPNPSGSRGYSYVDCNGTVQGGSLAPLNSISICAYQNSVIVVSGISVTQTASSCTTTTTTTAAPTTTTTTTAGPTTTTTSTTTTSTSSTTTTTTTASPTTTTTTTAGSLFTVYNGAKATSATPSEAEILASIATSQNAFADITANWTSFNATPQFCFFAVPDALGGTSIKNYWLDNNNLANNGHIGDPPDLFGPFTVVTVSGTPYKVWMTQYATQFTSNSISLKNAP